MIFWDLNNLKDINDRYGHAAGDKAIEKMSSVLYEFADERRRVYRIGGDEFLMIIDNPNDREAEDIVKSVAGNLEAENDENQIKISGAAGWAAGKGNEIFEVVEAADAHMYEDKKISRAGRM